MPTDNTKMGDYYDKMTPELYDAMMGGINYTEPDEIVKAVVQLKLEPTAKIIDIGAGTGLIGTKLIKHGLENLYALDASQELLKSLEEKKIYKSSTLAWLGYGKHPEEEHKEQYDLCTAAGVFMKGHMPKESMPEILGFLKKGGFFVTSMRDMYYTEGEVLGYYGMIQEMINSGLCKMHDTYTFKRGLPEEQNVSGNPLFRETNSHLFVFQKL